MSGQAVKASPDKGDPEILVPVIEEDLWDFEDLRKRQAAQAWSSYWLHARNRIQFTYRHQKVSRAGGPTNLGNKSAISIIRANDVVESGKSGLWTGGGGVLSRPIGPGDTIVPDKAIGGVVWKNVLAIAQIAQSAALSAAVAGI